MTATSQLSFNKTYEKNARPILKVARSHKLKTSLAAVSVVSSPATTAVQPAIYPFSTPMVRPLMGPMGRKIGETTIARQRYGYADFWGGTPLEKKLNVGSPDVIFGDTDFFSNWEEVGFNWNLKENILEAYLTRDNKTYKVKIPVAKISGIFAAHKDKYDNDCACEQAKAGAPFYPANWATEREIAQNPGFAKARLDAIKRKAKSYVYNGKTYTLPKAIEPNPPASPATAMLMSQDPAFARARATAFKKGKTSYTHKGKKYNLPKPARNCGDFFSWIGCAVDDAGKWVGDAVKEVGKVVDEVGKVALDVVSSPVFAGVMSAISVIPPLTAVGGLGLAATAAANIAKPAIAAIDSVGKAVKTGETVVKMASGVAGKVDVSKALSAAKNLEKNLPKLPKPARQLMQSALASTPYKAPTKKPVVYASSKDGATKAAMKMVPVKATPEQISRVLDSIPGFKGLKLF